MLISDILAHCFVEGKFKYIKLLLLQDLGINI
jgi:hypothetical protein